MNLLLVLLGLSLPAFALDQTDPKIKQELNSLALQFDNANLKGGDNSAVYCSGFHCYHFSLEFCDRFQLPESNPQANEFGKCQSVVLLPNKDHKVGHAINLIHKTVKLENKTIEIHCIVEPQWNTFNKEKCFEIPVDESNLENRKKLILENICKVYYNLDPYCKDSRPMPEALIKIPPREELMKTHYSPWWENQSVSDGQLFDICQRRNSETNARHTSALEFSLPAEMPTCGQVIAKGCPDEQKLKACKSRHPSGGDSCKTYYCNNQKINLVTKFGDLKLPACNLYQSQKSEFCQIWLERVKGHLKRIEGNFILNQTKLYCRHPEKDPGAAPRTGEFKCQLNEKTKSYYWTHHGEVHENTTDTATFHQPGFR